MGTITEEATRLKAAVQTRDAAAVSLAEARQAFIDANTAYQSAVDAVEVAHAALSAVTP